MTPSTIDFFAAHAHPYWRFWPSPVPAQKAKRPMRGLGEAETATSVKRPPPESRSGYAGPMKSLTTAEAAAQLAAQGPNELARGRPKSAVLAFFEQLKSPLILLLLGAAGVSAALGEVAEAVAIALIVVINAAVGFVQEFRAEKALLAMRQLTAPRAKVVRDEVLREIEAREVVTGDVLVLDAGDIVAADATLFEASALTVAEAALTGESAPVEKRVEPAAAEAPLAEQHHRVFMGTIVTNGSGRAVVENTGSRTQLGQIAGLLDTVKETETPLQQQLARVGRVLLLACLGIVAVVGAVGLWRGKTWSELFISSVSLAVAAVPEGLPAIVTIALAIGVQRMAKRNVLVRRLPSVETLGSATVIATDKTGTLTTGEMTLRELWGPDDNLTLRTAIACCDAELAGDGTATGDPTEIALLRAGHTRGLHRAELEVAAPRVEVHPFDSVRKRMSIWRADGILSVKGAVDLLLPLCTSGTAGATEANATMAERGLRVLAVARGRSNAETTLELVGLVGLADPPRPEAVAAIAEARAAGIRVVMMTGDHPKTAEAIAREMGLLTPTQAVTGVVYSRVTPEQKLHIVRDLKAAGEVVAVTGDGVNDAPALKEAHLGIAMGKTGVEVTREAADMVLVDDNFASIVAAVREGRGIYDNIQKALVYLLGGNVAEVLVVFLASLLGQPAPLLPLYLLWVNLVSDGFPALALVMDPPSPDLLQRQPRPANAPILAKPEWARIATIGGLVGAVTLAMFTFELGRTTVAEARTVAFSTLVFAQAFLVFASRHALKTNFEIGAFTNPRLIAVCVLTCVLQVALVALPWSNQLLELGPFSWSHLGLSFAAGLVPTTVLELSKIIRSRAKGVSPRPG